MLLGKTFSCIGPLGSRTVHYASKKTSLTHYFDRQLKINGHKAAIVDTNGCHTYDQIVGRGYMIGHQINAHLSRNLQKQVALLLPNNSSYVTSSLAVWNTGHIAVPLHTKYPASLLQYYLTDSQAKLLITTEEMKPLLNELKTNSMEVLVLGKDTLEADADAVDPTTLQTCKEENDCALIIYTSGTTGPPKGVVLSHSNLYHLVSSLSSAWVITSKDVLLHCLPLNHVHGIVNALLCPLMNGGTVIMERKFDAATVWSKFLQPHREGVPKPNLFMAVPTMYSKLMDEFQKRVTQNEVDPKTIKEKIKHDFRLMVSGSAALAPEVLKKWEEMTGHVLLERYGMTEIGMALSNPLHGKRKPGCVGLPLPGVQVKICSETPDNERRVVATADNDKVLCSPGCEGMIGDLLVKSPGVFKEYFGKKEATRNSFEDGWFKTGDIACYENDTFRIVGRSSVDVIKRGGHKISALDIEREMAKHENILDVAVVGVPDEVYGQKIAALIVWQGETDFDMTEVQSWLKKRLPSFQIPSEMKVLPDCIPRNEMGKVNKKKLVEEFFLEG